jgi:hypothetical protein
MTPVNKLDRSDAIVDMLYAHRCKLCRPWHHLTESFMNLKTPELTRSSNASPRIKACSRFAGKLPDLLASLGLAAFLFLAQSNVALAATAPPLGTAAPYGIASGTLTNTVAGTSTNGRICYTTGPAVAVGNAGFDQPCPPQVGSDQGTALAILNGAGQGCVPLPVNPLAGTLPPGCYETAGAINMANNTTVTLSGNGIYIFRSTGGAINTGSGTQVLLAGGACADNVFWTGAGATTLGANSTFVGNILDAAGVTIGANTTMTGRALALAGTVTTDTDTITLPTACAAILPSGSVSDVPTLSQWAMILLTGLLAIGGFAAMRRKQRQSTRPL